MRYRRLFNSPILLSIIVCWLTLYSCFALALHKKDLSTFSTDCKVYYMASATLMSGKNPYNPADMFYTCRLRDPKGMWVGGGSGAASNVPLPFVLFTPFTIFDWATASRLIFALNLLCIPLIFTLSAKVLDDKLPAHRLYFLCFISAIFPPVWKDVYVGQNALTVLAAQLGCCALVGTSNPVAVFALISFACNKITCSAPVFLVSIVKGVPSEKLAALIAFAAFVALNILIVLHMGWHSFLVHYSQANSMLFGPNACNDPYTSGRLIRIDDAPLLAMFVPRSLLTPCCLMLSVVLAIPLVALIFYRKSSPGVVLISSLLYTLTTLYHRPYDAVLALPFIYFTLRESNCKHSLAAGFRLASLLAVVLVFGDHNVFNVFNHAATRFDFPFIRPVITISMYLSMVFPELRRTALKSQATTKPILGSIALSI